MLRRLSTTVTRTTNSPLSILPRLYHCSASVREAPGDDATTEGPATFAESLLPFLVCPLAKTPLRYDRQQQLLINDDYGISYPIVNGVPYLIPTKAKVIQQK